MTKSFWQSVVLTKDARCANPRYEMVFTDISKGKGITASNRRLFVREKDGTLTSTFIYFSRLRHYF